MQNEGKYRLLSILEILSQHGTEDAPLSSQKINEYLVNEYNIKSHRTTISNDIEILMSFGFDIHKIESTANKYYMRRTLDENDVWLINSVMATSRFVEDDEREELVSKLVRTFVKEERKMCVDCNVGAEARIKDLGKEGRERVRVIDRAIRERRKISFKYFMYDENKEVVIRNSGERYIISPFTVISGKDVCYMVGFCDKGKKLRVFNLARILGVPEILEESAVKQPKSMNFEDCLYSRFSSYNAKLTYVELVCTRNAMDEIIQRFGINVKTSPLEDGAFSIKVKVPVGDEFFGWLFVNADKIKLTAPKDTVAEYEDKLRTAVGNFVKK